MIDLQDELAEQYLAECQEHMATIDRHLYALEKGGAEVDEKEVKLAIRAVHLIQGEASLFGLMKIGALASRMEDELGAIQADNTLFTKDRIGGLIKAADRLHELIQNPGASNQAAIADILTALDRLQADDAGLAEVRYASAFRRERQPGLLRVLLVEDDFTSRLLLQTFLARYGDCHIAVNGREAVEAFRSATERGLPYDMICLDIMMPEMDGREALQQIRALEAAHGILCNQGAKIVMTTTVSQMKEVVACFRELCDAYLLKPIDLSKLLSLIKSYQLIP